MRFEPPGVGTHEARQQLVRCHDDFRRRRSAIGDQRQTPLVTGRVSRAVDQSYRSAASMMTDVKGWPAWRERDQCCDVLGIVRTGCRPVSKQMCEGG